MESVTNDRHRTAGAVFTPDGEYLVTHGGRVFTAFGPRASRFLAASGGTVWGIDPTALGVEWVTELDGVVASALAVTEDGERAVVGTEDGRVVMLG